MRRASHTSVLLALVLCSTAPAVAQQDVPAAPVSTQALPAAEKPLDGRAEKGTSFHSLVAALGRDLVRIPSKDTALTLGVGGALALAVQPADRDLTRRARSSELLDRTLEIGEPLGSGWAQFGGALGTFAAGHAIRNPRLQTLGADLIRAQALNSVLTQALKLSVARTRPDGTLFSFPSGHTSASFANATVLQQHFGWKVGVPAYGAAAYVAASRLQENRHYASDVIFGAALGIVAGRTVMIGRGAGRFAMSPMPLPGGIGVTFRRVATP